MCGRCTRHTTNGAMLKWACCMRRSAPYGIATPLSICTCQVSVKDILPTDLSNLQTQTYFYIVFISMCISYTIKLELLLSDWLEF